jgi:hypothetical protein
MGLRREAGHEARDSYRSDEWEGEAAVGRFGRMTSPERSPATGEGEVGGKRRMREKVVLSVSHGCVGGVSAERARMERGAT